MSEPQYNIWIRGINIDSNANIVGLKRLMLVTDYVKLEFKRKYNDVGGWTLLMRDGTEEAQMLRKLLIGTSDDPQGQTSSGRGYGGIVVVRNGEIIFAGPVRGFTATGDNENGEMIEFRGADDNIYLEDRICMTPNDGTPFHPAPPGPPGSHRWPADFVSPSLTGWQNYVYPTTAAARRSTSEVLANIILIHLAGENNEGYPVNENRAISFLTVSNTTQIVNETTENAGNVGPDYRVRFRYQTVLSKCQEVGTYVQLNPAASDYDTSYRGLQFHIQHTDEDTFHFVIKEPKNLTDSVILHFGNQDLNLGGNIGTYQYSFDSPKVTHCVIGGQGEETSRWFANTAAEYSPDSVVPNANLVFGLREYFIDRRDIQYADPGGADNAKRIEEFFQAMYKTLREEGEIVNLEVTALNAGNTQFFEQYNLGDVITVYLQGQELIAQVTDYTVTLTKAEGEVVVPTIGTQPTGSTISLFRELNRTDEELRYLQIR